MSHVLENAKIARNYAQALSAVVGSVAEFDLVVSEMHKLSPLLSSEQALKIWHNPVLSRHQKSEFLAEIMAEIASTWIDHQSVVSNFIGVVLKNTRMNLLPLIDQELDRISAYRKNIKLAQLSLATPLAKEMEQEIKAVAEQMFHSKLRWTVAVDPTLMAGFRIVVEHTCFDGSMRARLRQLKSHFHKDSQML